MFRSSTILRDFIQSLAKVTLLFKHSVKLRHCIYTIYNDVILLNVLAEVQL